MLVNDADRAELCLWIEVSPRRKRLPCSTSWIAERVEGPISITMYS